mgnify:CR=1 FL=1
MESEVDTSILNTVNIKRFTKSVLEEYGADIDRSNKAKWEVDFPEKISKRLDRRSGTLVFEAADRELGAGDLLVQPGTTVFSTLLDLVQMSGSIGSLRLTEDNLQVNPPEVLQESNLNVVTSDFSEDSSDLALAFHFRVQFETPSSFHNEEMISVTIDPETRNRLPDITERLTSHLPQLLEQNEEQPFRDVPETEAQELFKEAQQAVVDRARPIVSEIKQEADESASERIEEISDWYDQRREELDKQVKEKREEVQEWREKRRKARKDSTRMRYVKNQKQAEEDLEELREEVEEKKHELDIEEGEEIDEVIDRNSVEVDISLIGVTEVTYVRGTLLVDISSENVETEAELSYLPATDQFRGLDCGVCSQDLTTGILPRLCRNGHLIGDPCSVSCRNCGLTYCENCESGEGFETCVVCWEAVCEDCIEKCSSCGSPICTDHRETCAECDVICHLCGEECSTGGTFHCDEHLVQCSECLDMNCAEHSTKCEVCDSVRCETDTHRCSKCDDALCTDHSKSCSTCGSPFCDEHLAYCSDCGELHCAEHIEKCEICGSIRCEEDMTQCSECNEPVCTNHSMFCDTCGDTFCEHHAKECSVCVQDQGEDTKYLCEEHEIQCSVGGKIICSEHSAAETIGSGYVCREHRKSCEVCGMGYSEESLNEGRCTACASLNETPEEQVPANIISEFRSVKVGSNEVYMVILGKKLLGRNKLIVYDLETKSQIKRESAGMLKQLSRRYK